MIDEQEFGEALEAVGAKNLIEHWTKEDYKVSQFESCLKDKEFCGQSGYSVQDA
jgi:hypothetical protein